MICLWMGKTTKAKPHRMILKSPLPIIHYYRNKRLQVKEFQYLISTYSWTLTLIPNWICSVVTISHFQCTALSTWLTNRCADHNTWLDHQLEKDVGCKVLQFIQAMKINKLLGYKTLSAKTKQLLQEKDELGQIVSGHNFRDHFALSCITFDGP